MLFTKDNTFIVTGASSGIGREFALKLNEEGASVVAVARSSERLTQVKSLSSNPKNFYTEVKDLTEDIDNLPTFIKELKEKYGKFKGLACIAGTDKVLTTQMLNKKDIDEVFTLNYTVPIMLAKGFVDKRNNVGRGSNILFIASITGVFPDKGQIVYGASKAALIAAMVAISKEIAPKGLRCNSISPALVETPMFERQKDSIGISTEQYALGIGKPLDIANVGIFIMSDKASWITASNYIMTGGVTNGKYI